jgi:hypothetical protein
LGIHRGAYRQRLAAFLDDFVGGRPCWKGLNSQYRTAGPTTNAT